MVYTKYMWHTGGEQTGFKAGQPCLLADSVTLILASQGGDGHSLVCVFVLWARIHKTS